MRNNAILLVEGKKKDRVLLPEGRDSKVFEKSLPLK